MPDPFDHPRDQHPACVASGCKCMPKAHCITLCVETLKTTLTPERIVRIARSEMPACFNVTRELAVALAQKAAAPDLVAFSQAAIRFARALLEADRLDALEEGECTDAVYQAACDEYNLSKRLMGEAYAATLIKPVRPAGEPHA